MSMNKETVIYSSTSDKLRGQETKISKVTKLKAVTAESLWSAEQDGAGAIRSAAAKINISIEI